jgi:hypothetical protein
VHHGSGETAALSGLGCAGGLIARFGDQVDQGFEEPTAGVGVLLGGCPARGVTACGGSHWVRLGTNMAELLLMYNNNTIVL